MREVSEEVKWLKIVIGFSAGRAWALPRLTACQTLRCTTSGRKPWGAQPQEDSPEVKTSGMKALLRAQAERTRCKHWSNLLVAHLTWLVDSKIPGTEWPTDLVEEPIPCHDSCLEKILWILCIGFGIQGNQVMVTHWLVTYWPRLIGHIYEPQYPLNVSKCMCVQNVVRNLSKTDQKCEKSSKNRIETWKINGKTLQKFSWPPSTCSQGDTLTQPEMAQITPGLAMGHVGQ